MAWNTEHTRERLLVAATAEFAEHGLAGGRVDRIARAAGVNKERIYSYFSNKDGLFAAVLERSLLRVADAAPLTGETTDDVVRYAVAVFDHHAEDPTLARLLAWEGLERSGPVALGVRSEQMATKVDHLGRALPGVDRADLEELLLTIISLAVAWPVLRTLGMTIDPGAARRAARRSAVEETIRSQVTAWGSRSDQTGDDTGTGANL